MLARLTMVVSIAATDPIGHADRNHRFVFVLGHDALSVGFSSIFQSGIVGSNSECQLRRASKVVVDS